MGLSLGHCLARSALLWSFQAWLPGDGQAPWAQDQQASDPCSRTGSVSVTPSSSLGWALPWSQLAEIPQGSWPLIGFKITFSWNTCHEMSAIPLFTAWGKVDNHTQCLCLSGDRGREASASCWAGVGGVAPPTCRASPACFSSRASLPPLSFPGEAAGPPGGQRASQERRSTGWTGNVFVWMRLFISYQVK